ncbi:MAG: TraR/DksA family transcriptional regulator [Planctomycetota bacterium]|jgi:RNA polymerase-binding protein DksA
MAKKKVTKKKTTKKKVAKTVAKKPAKKPAKKTTKKTTKKKVAKTVAKKPTKKTTKKTTKKKVAKTVAKKTTATAPRGEKTAVKAKAPVKAPAKTTRKKTTVGKGATAAQKAAAAKAARAAPDANGYVIINGRRVRMMSTSVPPVVTKKPRSRAKTAAEPAPEAAKQKPIKTKLKKKDLDHYRELLLERRRELVGDLSAMEQQALQATSSNVSHMPIHMADIGTDTYDQDFMLGLAENERRRLREIDAALVRIEDRTYGVCQMTGRVIPKARLNAKPWARYTIEAARQIESGVGE